MRCALLPPGFRAGDRVGGVLIFRSFREGERYRIEYNTRGVATTRKIKFLKIHRFGRRRMEQYVEAYCYLRKRKRTFRLDRITLITPIH